MRTTTRWKASLLLAGLAVVAGCDDDPMGPEPLDPDTAPRAMVDRFSDDAGTLFQRSGNASLPGAGDPIDMDQAPFITQGLGPEGQPIRYYNFDVQATTPAPIYVLIDESTDQPVPDQLNIVDAIPGDPGYNDFWRVVRVMVPEDYVANTATSLADLQAAGYDMETTDILVNCPIVPEGSAASEGGGAAGLTRGWYEDELVFYFNFGEASLEVTQAGTVPISPIYVTFNINPDQPGGGPPSGFMTEPASVQTHNVVGTVPGDVGYSPLWEVRPYDNASFDQVMDLATAQAAPSFGAAALVNCPVVFEGP